MIQHERLTPATLWQATMGLIMMHSDKALKNSLVIFYHYDKENATFTTQKIEDPNDPNRGRFVNNAMFTYGNTVVLAPMSNVINENNGYAEGTQANERLEAFSNWYKNLPSETRPTTILIPVCMHYSGHYVYVRVDIKSFNPEQRLVADLVDSKQNLDRPTDYANVDENILKILQTKIGIRFLAKKTMNIVNLETQNMLDTTNCGRYVALGIKAELVHHKTFAKRITDFFSFKFFSGFGIIPKFHNLLESAYKYAQEKMPLLNQNANKDQKPAEAGRAVADDDFAVVV